MTMPWSALTLPKLVKVWLQVTSFVCFIDGWFIVLRPHTFPEGKLGFLFYPYKYYYTIDKMYGDVKDSFVYAQAVCNLLEVVTNLTALYLNNQISECRGAEAAITVSRKSKLLALIVNTMTFWKTILYFIVYYNMDFRKDNSLLQEFILVFCLNGVWIVVPFVCMYVLFQDLAQQYSKDSSSPRTNMILRESTMKQRRD